jgi:cytochrome c oxidase cbb3-type subunit III
MNGFWNYWVAGLVTANIVFIAWLLYVTARRRGSGDSTETTGHVWDGDLREYNNPLPRWWLGIFYGSIVFGIVYLVLFPGFGNFEGVLHWSQTGQWRSQKADADAVFEREFSRFDHRSIADLSTDPSALKIARNLFAANCAACHGADAHGAKGFPNLSSPNLTWGRSGDDILATIADGRVGAMPAWKDVLGENGVREVANYVYMLSGRSAVDAKAAQAGKARFDMTCTACHGADGKGNTLLGAPNLTDEYWIYGGSLATITETIANGRGNRMPAHRDLLGMRKVRLLAAYVYSLAPPAAAAPTTPGT